ncbi:tetratricopeptide repeat family protein [Prevotella sp. CAG:1124]|nr:tetratricopeptide repeat family protein [Prevotella sp. CAG:1124]
MKAIKYVLAGVLMTSVFAPSMAQDVKSQVEAIKKVVTDNKSNPAAAEEQVKDFVKENKKNAEALAGLGRAYFEIKDTASAREYAMMAIDRGKDDKGKALAYILLGDIAALSDEGGGAASQYNQAMLLDPQNPTGYIKYAAVYRKVDPEGSVAVLEKLRQVQPDYPVDAEAGHFFYGANKFDKAIEYYGKVDLNQLKENYLTEYATAALLMADSKKSLEVSLFGVNKNPRDAAMNRITFYNYTDLKDYKNAIKYADALFNKSDSAKISARDHQYYGYALMGDSAFDQAIEQFKKALEMNAELNDVRKQLSDAYLAKNDFTNGLAYYDEYLSKIEKPSVPDLDGLAKLYMQQAASMDSLTTDKVNAFKKADEIYGKIAADSPGNKLYATMMRARINSQLDPESTQGLAKPYYEEYAQLAQTEQANNPKLLIEPYLYLGYYYILKEDNATAKTYYEKVKAIDPQNSIANQALEVLK